MVGRHLPAVPRHGQRPEPRTRREEGAAGAEIAGLLHPHRIAGVDQEAGEQVERGLSRRS